MKLINTFIVCLISLSFGCATKPEGIISPPPSGCIHLEYFSEINPKAKLHSGEDFIHVITPTDRMEPLMKKWSVVDFEKGISEKEMTEKDATQHSLPDGSTISLPNKFGNTRIPGRDVWEQVRTDLKPNDEIWTFGVLDCGTVIIRNGKVFCMIVVTHNM